MKHEDNGDGETTRSGLFMEAIRIIKEMREATDGRYPTFAFWENVPGAFSSNKGEDFRIVLEELIKIVEPEAPPLPPAGKNGWAYADCIVGDGWSIAYRVFDAQYWGVPQRRRRIALIADFAGERAGEILFERESLSRNSETRGTLREAVAGDAERSVGTDDRDGKSHMLRAETHGVLPCVILKQYLFENHSQDARYKGPLSICPMLSAQLGTGGNNQPLVVEAHVLCLQSNSIDRADTNLIVKHIDTTHADDVVRVDDIDSPLQARDYKGGKLVRVGYVVRRLTPTECARLQGFPDCWGHIDHKDDFTDDEYRFWLDVRNTHASINGKTVKEYTKAQMLTWYNKLHTDSAEYKMWGNGVALPFVRFPISRMAALGAKTLGSLFDGSGGFPLAGVLEGITPLWASEIEPYPIAVTVSRFNCGKDGVLPGQVEMEGI